MRSPLLPLALVIAAVGLGAAACAPATSRGPTLAAYFAPEPGVQEIGRAHV